MIKWRFLNAARLGIFSQWLKKGVPMRKPNNNKVAKDAAIANARDTVGRFLFSRGIHRAIRVCRGIWRACFRPTMRFGKWPAALL